ncbi:MAG: substrate-binding domain-containing protein [Acidobacteria bacterium]|nr:substrate-binding domain-containing protein [Acidobacteriota bacterium]
MEVQQHLKVDRRSSVPLETQIARQLTQLIASDAIRVGDRLPPIRDLAGKLGVNLHTVRAGYRTLANQGLVEMRQGRGTTVAARTLAGFAAGRDDHRSFTMGVILPAMVSFYGPVLAGMEEAAAGDPSQILIAFAGERLDSAESYLRHFVATGVDGIIVVSQTLPDSLDLDATDLPPMVFADWPGSPEPSVVLDPSPVGELIRHLAEHGHATVGLITPPMHHPNIRPIVEEYEATMAALGLSTKGSGIFEVPGWTPEEGRAAMAEILKASSPPTAVICSTDPLAIGAIQATRRSGLVVGRDLAIAGYGEIEVSEIVEPGLTTVRLPARQMGYMAMVSLLDQLAGKPVEPLTELKGSVVIRQSCGCGHIAG